MKPYLIKGHGMLSHHHDRINQFSRIVIAGCLVLLCRGLGKFLVTHLQENACRSAARRGPAFGYSFNIESPSSPKLSWNHSSGTGRARLEIRPLYIAVSFFLAARKMSSASFSRPV